MAGVLLVSAAPDQQSSLIEWLKIAPYQLQVASELEAIWPWLVEASTSPHLILLDNYAPVSPSIPLIQEIKVRAPAVEVLVLAEPQRRVEALRAGAYSCLANPLDLAELELVLERAEEYCYLKVQVAEAGGRDRAANLYSQEADKIRRLELLAQTSEGTRKQLDILYQELRKAHHTAKIVAEVTTLETLDNTLHSVAAGTREALDCDAVTLYGYSPLKESLIYPPIMVGVHFPEKASSRPDIPKNHIALEILKRNRPHIAETVKADPLFAMTRFARDEEIASCMAIPLKVGSEPLGVMFVNYRASHQFTLEELAHIELFAHQAAVAIHNAQQYEELRRVKMLVGARTGLAWLGMANSIWRHATDKHALTIREQIQLLRRNLLQLELKDQKIVDRLAMIERLANKIIEKPLTLPLAAEERLEPVAINELISERANQLWRNDPYRMVELGLDFQLPGEVMVSASPEWLRRAFDILVDNAVNAVAEQELQKVVVGSRLARGGAEIFVADTGPGLPEAIRQKIGLEFIEKSEDAKGMGMGLLMAQTIVQTYGGEIRVEATGPGGTEMVLWLPLKK